MIVLYWMTPDPVVCRPADRLLDVREKLVRHGIRRVPVVDDDSDLVGVIGRSDLYRWVRPDRLFETLEETEERALAEHFVREQMTQPPLTCSAYDPIEVVARRMAEEKCGAYPVLNRGHLVGIISETDLMRSIAQLAHEGTESRRITLRIEGNEDDALYRIVDLARRSRLSLRAVLTHPILGERATIATLRVDGAGVDRFVRSLWDAAFKVTDVD